MPSLLPMLLGTGGAQQVSFTNVLSHVASSNTGAADFTSLDINTDGTITSSKSVGGTWSLGPYVSASWFLPTGGTPGNSYWVRVTPTSGSFTSGDTTSTWLALSTNRSWRITEGVSGTLSVTCTIEIAADSGGTTILATKTGVILDATFV